MGMFDTISIHNKWFPKGTNKKVCKLYFQTKDLECTLSEFEINEEGILIKCVGENKKEIYSYTGAITFYANDHNCIWVEFTAWCVESKVKEVVQIKPCDQ